MRIVRSVANTNSRSIRWTIELRKPHIPTGTRFERPEPDELNSKAEILIAGTLHVCSFFREHLKRRLSTPTTV